MEELEIIKGDTLVFDFEIEGLKQDLESCFFSCKKDKTSLEYTFQKSLNNGITKIDTTDNSRVYQVKISPEDTKNMKAGYYYYDIQIKVGDDVFTPLLNQLKIIEDITKEE